MTCKVCQRLIFDLVDGALSASKAEEVLVHARTCPECGRFLSAERARLDNLPKAFDHAALGGKLPPAAVERFSRNMRAATKQRGGAQGKRPPT